MNIKNKLFVSLILTLLLSITNQANALGIFTKIKANNQTGHIDLISGSPLTLDIELDPSVFLGVTADYWVLAQQSSTGTWYSYIYPTGWIQINDINHVRPAYQGPLILIDKFTVLSATVLPDGEYTAYFGFDFIQNGVIDYPFLHYDQLTISIGKIPQTISFGTAQSINFGGSGVVIATGGASGNPVIISSKTPLVCSVNANTVTSIAAGTCRIAADQAGNTNYIAATEATQTLTIGKAVQIISGIQFNPAKLSVGNSTTVSANSTSTLPISFSSATPSICSTSDSNGVIVTALTDGICVINANQSGDSNHTPAQQASQNLTISLFYSSEQIGTAWPSWPSSSRIDSFKVNIDTQGLYITLSLCSQSASNYRQNSVTVSLVTDNVEIARKSESYNSQSNWGPIPCYDHVLKFPAIWLKSGDVINMQTIVAAGDYVNRLVEETISSGSTVGLGQTPVCSNYSQLNFNNGYFWNNQ